MGLNMSRARKSFRIEQFFGDVAPARVANSSYAPGGSDTQLILAEIAKLREALAPTEELSQRSIDQFKKELAEAQKIKAELDDIYKAIEQTKHEIATLHTTGFKGEQMVRVTGELDAIVQGTFDATEGILTAAESIDKTVSLLEASVKTQQERQLAADVQDNVVKIFEACNFQDLTGQRITKVVGTLKFIEDRIVRMMNIWGGIDTFKNVHIDVIAAKEGDASLLNGPKLSEERGHASQDDIDALFN